MSRKILFSVIVFLIGSGYSYPQWITNHKPIFMPDISKPVAFGIYTDPSFGTKIERISSCITSGLNAIVPDYSKRQAWNADESLLLLRSGEGEVLLCNGNDYKFIKMLNTVNGEDVFWHPSDPKYLYFTRDSVFYSFNIDTEEEKEIHAFTKYTWANTRAEGNMSRDGRYYAVVGQQYNYSTGDVIFKDIVVYNIQTNSEISSMPIPQDSISEFDWVSVSPLGKYVVVDYADETIGRYHGVEVYDLNMNFVWQKPLGAGHSDLGLDEAGNEVLVMDVYNADSNKTYLKKHRLSDGQETVLLELSQSFFLHISMRNIQRQEWCFISTFDNFGRLTDDSLSWLPFEDEVFALKLDGSGNVQRLAHHHSRRFSPSTPDPDNSVYWAEPHATVNRNGTKIIFGSNWRQSMQVQNSVDAYIIDITDFLGKKENPIISEEIYLFPNPASNVIEVSYYDFNHTHKSVVNSGFSVYNVLGEKVFTIPYNDNPTPTIHLIL